jgi:hypothetical protein
MKINKKRFFTIAVIIALLFLFFNTFIFQNKHKNYSKQTKLIDKSLINKNGKSTVINKEIADSNLNYVDTPDKKESSNSNHLKKKILKKNEIKINTSSVKNNNISTSQTILREEGSPDITPNLARSIFHEYWVSYFADAFKNKKINIDEGKKIVCLFNPINNFDVEVAKSLKQLLKNSEIPPVYTVFGNGNSDTIFAFYKKAGCNFPTTETDLKGFNNYLGDYKCPVVFYLWNGNIIKVYDGEDLNKFNPEELKKVCNDKYVPKKRIDPKIK